ncbi:adenylyl-sulfate kinase [Fodinicola acaciae]|uniref:adenylyl-sulfate kinase n=1 Tax=Fodinicola acaciae TaxID=2681555 RepID=UPI001C9E98BE|nr:adenylyl-sulfate kinase [Fodinicola acaciae]
MTSQLALDGAALGHAELLLSGAYAPLTGFMTSAEAASWPAPVTLAAEVAGDQVELTDPEGAPIALMTVEERWDGHIAGPLKALKPLAYGPFQALRRLPADVTLPAGAVAVVAERPLTPADVPDAPLLVIVPIVAGRERLVRAVRDSVDGVACELIALPLPEPALAGVVARNYGADQLVRLAAEDMDRRGLVVFFTGLSGSGKSTVARGLVDRLRERGDRTITMLDGDVVRRLLSKGLTFSREDRDLNIRRIGFVAAEVARHGGLAVCAPIAPYASTRAEVRAMVEAAGGRLMLVHVSTPLEVCEQRDRKGLYAKARAGLIPEFTGISDPYETPTDADLTIDTSTMSEAEAVEVMLTALKTGYDIL